MQILIAILLLIIIFIVYWYSDILFIRQYHRNKYYKMAYVKSIETNKPLMIIGDPTTGDPVSRLYSKIYPYGYGNVCLDFTGCSDAPSLVNKVKGNIELTLPTFENNSHVIFICVLLEYVDKIEFVIDELYRISGGDLYVVYGKHMLLKYKEGDNWMYIKNKILKAPPKFDTFEWKRLVM